MGYPLTAYHSHADQATTSHGTLFTLRPPKPKITNQPFFNKKTYSEFEQHALECNVSKEQVPDALAFLHKIGDVAYFGDDPSDGKFLNPFLRMH